MSWLADFHIHSHFSMATSKECNPKNLHRWAGLKGVSLVGTGDFTHPGWRTELRDSLVPAEPGFYRLKEHINQEIPGQPEVRFVVTGELSSIYKKNGRVRKVHHLIVLPSLEDAGRVSDKLEEMGMNIRSDGRPILGLDSYRLFELILETSPEVIFIPAHIWTPHFSVFGSNSGFDDINECYEDLTQYIFALETGLSSDPGMNWRWSALDRFTLVSNSDAHNPQNLAREANIFEAEFSYRGLKEALQEKNSGKFLGTVEFFPEEGKYHYDGHRNCEVCLKPEETIANKGVCPVCGRKVTVGVLHRVAELADRVEGFKQEGAPLYESMVPLKEIIGSAINSSASSKKVEELYFDLLKRFGPELTVLREAELSEIARIGGVLVAEGIRRLRTGEVSIQPGYDGAYGIISVLREDDRQTLKGQAALFDPGPERSSRKGPLLGSIIKELASQAEEITWEQRRISPDSGLSREQIEIVRTDRQTVIVTAGPGTGKTRTLVERIAYLVKDREINPAEITGVTFTNKAASEMRTRLNGILSGEKRASRINLGTFHSLCWRILNNSLISPGVKLLDEFEAREILEEVLRQNRIPMTAREASLMISLVKNKYLWDESLAIPPKVAEVYQAYQQSLQAYQRCDFDDILLQAVELWEENPDWLQPVKKQFNYLLVDEFQDLNLLQYKLVKLWATGNKSLMVIGDPNQSIYGFRGAGPQFFDRLKQEFPEVASFHLSRNYRTPSVIVKAANALIKEEYQQSLPETERISKKIVWFEASTEKTAARAVINEIINLLGGSTMLSAHGQKMSKRGTKVDAGSYGLSDFAVLYRTGKQADAIEQILLTEGLPYRVVGPAATLDSLTVREFLTFFRYLKDPHDLFLLRANLRQPRWGLKNNEVAEIIDWLKNQVTASSDSLQQLMNADIAPELLAKLRQFHGVIQYYQSQTGKKSQEIIEDWMLRMDPVEPGDLEKLKKICENYRNLEELIQFLPLATEADIFRKGQKTTGVETITLSTIHAAKGLEFPVVLMVGVEEGLLPYGNEPDPETVAEEQRLFYVGLTRTQQQLYLINSQLRYRYGDTVSVEVSRFVKLIPNDLMEKIIPEQHDRKAKQLELF